MKKARIWLYHNKTFVRVTVTPDSPMELSGGGRTEEGYQSWGEAIALGTDDDNEPVLYRQSWSDSRDCDGRMTTEATLQCQLDRLTMCEPYDPNSLHKDVKLPDWQKCSRSQRDYAAEAMGY